MLGYCNNEFVGLAVGSTILRVVSIDIRNNKITAFSEEQVDKQMLDGGTFLAPEIFKTALKKLIQKSKNRPGCISVSLPERYALTRELTFPAIRPEEIAEAVNWQARNIFPLPLEDMYIDWKILSGKDLSKEVFVVALPRRLIDDLVLILRQMDFKPVNIQTAATCLGRLLPPAAGKLQILINVNRDGSTATLVENQVAKMTATSSLSAKPAKDAVRETITTAKKLREFYQAKHPSGVKIDQVWLTGEWANEELRKRIVQDLKLKAEFLQLPLTDESKTRELAYSEAIAVALAPIEPPESTQTINLLPLPIQELYDSSLNLRKFKLWTRIVLSILLFALAISIISYGYLWLKARSFTTTGKQVVGKAAAQNTEQRLAELNLQADKLLALAGEKKTPRSLLSNLPQLIPAGITIDAWQFNQAKKQLVLAGRTDSRSSLLNLQKILEARKEFARVTIPLDSLEKKANYHFRLIVQVNVRDE